MLGLSVLGVIQWRAPASARPEDPMAPGVTLLATLWRDQAVLADAVPVLQLPTLRAGDRLSFRVAGATGPAHVLLARRSGDAWDTLQDATLPTGGWLGGNIPIDEAPTLLRLKVCQAGARLCDEHTFEL